MRRRRVTLARLGLVGVASAVLGCATPLADESQDSSTSKLSKMPSAQIADEQDEPWGRGPAPPSAPRGVGGLRQVQLLSVVPATADAPGQVRFATAMRVGERSGRVAIYELPLTAASGMEEPRIVRTPTIGVDVEFELFPHWTWESRCHWRVLETDDARFLVAFDNVARRIEVRSFDGGQQLFEMYACDGFEDARVEDRDLRLLLRVRQGMRALTLDASGQVLSSQDTATPDLSSTVACFVGASPGWDAPNEIAIAGCRDGDLSVTLHRLDGGPSRTLTTHLALPDTSRLRIAAWSGDRLRRIAVGLPETFHGAGSVVLSQVDGGATPALLHQMRPFGLSEEALGGFSIGSAVQLGQALCFADDLDGDHLPELVLGGPDDLSGCVDIVSHADGLSRQLIRPDFITFGIGVSVSMDPTGRYLLTGGGYCDRPESLSSPARAVLLDLQSGANLVGTFGYDWVSAELGPRDQTAW